MKILGFKFKKFERNTTTISTIEAWIVTWESLHEDCIHKGKPQFETQVFLSQEDAKNFAQELIGARNLLGDNWPKPQVYKQKPRTNA